MKFHGPLGNLHGGFGSPVGEAFGVAGGEVAELFESGEASLDHVAMAVDLRIEVRWAASGGSFGLPAGDLVGALGAGESDPTGPQRGAGGGMRVGLVRDHPVRPFAGASSPVASHVELVEQREQLWVVSCLARGDQDRYRQAAAVDGEVDFAGEPASGPSKALAFDGERFDPPAAGPPFFRAPAAC